MWLLNSSIGKKLIMSISGLFLVLFLLFHLSMNVAAVFSGEAYNMVCSLLGSIGTLCSYSRIGRRRCDPLRVRYHSYLAKP